MLGVARNRKRAALPLPHREVEAVARDVREMFQQQLAVRLSAPLAIPQPDGRVPTDAWES
jgi:hypothetical protein